jgi:hypothetical protein
MTVSDIAPPTALPAWDAESAGPSLAALLTDLGIRQLEVISAPDGLNGPVCGAVIWEGVGESRIGAGDLVLAVGVTGAAELSHVLAIAAQSAAAGVITKRPEHLDLLRAEAQLHEMTVLCMGSDLTWHQLHSSLSAALATTRSLSQSSLGVLDGDLFALADAAAASLGGPVEIDDAAMQPLAYSNIDDDCDELRRTSILTRHPPAGLMEWLQQSGLLHQIRTAHRPVRVEPNSSRARLAMPIRAGVDLLGYIWLAEGTTPIDEVDPWVLIDAARMASGLMMRLRTVNTERRLPSELLRSALDGVGCPDVLMSHFPQHDQTQFRLVAFHLVDAERHRSDQRPILLQNLVALRAESAGYAAIATSRDDMVYVLLDDPPQSAPKATTSVARAQGFAELVVAHATQQLRTPLVAAVGHGLADLSTLNAARLEVDRLAAMIARTGPTVGTADSLRTRAVLAELRELAKDRPHLLSGPIETLRRLDETKGTEYLPTLRAYFDAQHDLAEAGKLLCVHRNTVRYRIARLQELCHIDLVSPTDRLVLQLQLHLLAD